MFSDSSVVSEKVVLIENEEVIRNDQTIGEHFNQYFANITDTLNIADIPKEPMQTTGNPVQDCILAYSNHPSIRIKGLINVQEKFAFSHVNRFSDFHHMILTIMKLQYHKLPPKKIKYRDYRKFSEENFLFDFSANLAKHSPDNIEAFVCLFNQTLEKFTPYKTVIVRGNSKPHMSNRNGNNAKNPT